MLSLCSHSSFSRNHIRYILYINFTGKNPKPIIKLKQKPTNIITITAIKKAELKQKPTNTAIITAIEKAELEQKPTNIATITIAGKAELK